jgi:hypothetical protein
LSRLGGVDVDRDRDRIARTAGDQRAPGTACRPDARRALTGGRVPCHGVPPATGSRASRRRPSRRAAVARCEHERRIAAGAALGGAPDQHC